ncbi:MAG: amidohydrolase family protein [Clostridiaceae bacterium]|nr:amidohydrolase family protein [Clostridiaceae bacterium]
MIDFHMHIFPDQLAGRALSTISRNSGGLEPCFDGTLAGLQTLMKSNGIDNGVVLMIATKPEQETAINRFAIEHSHGNLLFFGSVHPHSKNIRKNLQMLKEAGIRGIKLHPEYQNFSVDDPEVLPVYQMIAEMGFITVFHAGLDIGFDVPGRCRPAALARILPYFEGAPVVAAHLGGYMLWEEVERELVGKPIFFDTAYSYGTIPLPLVNRIIREHGVERILFGSDTPWSNPGQEITFINHLTLTAAEKNAVLDHNARRLLGLPELSVNQQK